MPSWGSPSLTGSNEVSFLLLYFWGDFAVGYVVAGIILLKASNQSCYVSESKSLSLCN